MRDRNGNTLPGYGWIFPVGDGTINVGVGLLSTFRDWKSVNTTHLLNEFAATAPAYWGISPETSCGEPTGGRLPMGGSVGPKAGPDVPRRRRRRRARSTRSTARASTTPTRRAAWRPTSCTRRSAGRDPAVLATYPKLLEAEYGQYFKVARLFARIIGRPA